MGRTFRTLLLVTGIMLVTAGIARGTTGEHSQIRFPAGSFAINHTTCRFLQPEADKNLGKTWTEGRIAFAYEDGRHDALDTCLRAREDRIASCIIHATPVDEAPADKDGYHDTRGVRAMVATLRICEADVTGLS